MSLAPDAWTSEDFYELHWLMKRLGQLRCTQNWARCRRLPRRRHLPSPRPAGALERSASCTLGRDSAMSGASWSSTLKLRISAARIERLETIEGKPPRAPVGSYAYASLRIVVWGIRPSMTVFPGGLAWGSHQIAGGAADPLAGRAFTAFLLAPVAFGAT